MHSITTVINNSELTLPNTQVDSSAVTVTVTDKTIEHTSDSEITQD